MRKNSINFDDKKSDFYNKNKIVFSINNIDASLKMLVSKKEKYGKDN